MSNFKNIITNTNNYIIDQRLEYHQNLHHIIYEENATIELISQTSRHLLIHYKSQLVEFVIYLKPELLIAISTNLKKIKIYFDEDESLTDRLLTMSKYNKLDYFEELDIKNIYQILIDFKQYIGLEI
jgi:hypothetical protein